MSTKKYGLEELSKDFGELTFGNALESYRLGENLSQKAMAEILEMSPQSLCDLEKGRRIPTPSRVAKIANKLNLPVSVWLQLALQDSLNKEHLNFKVSIA